MHGPNGAPSIRHSNCAPDTVDVKAARAEFPLTANSVIVVSGGPGPDGTVPYVAS